MTSSRHRSRRKRGSSCASFPTHDKAWFDVNRARIPGPHRRAGKGAGRGDRDGAAERAVAGDRRRCPRVNGSISPINRDIRFSADKTPYKDHLLFRWWEGEEKKTAPTLFVRLAADEVGFATGVMLPSLDRWRELVDAEATGAPLASAVAALVAETGADVAGIEYKRVPKPYAADHPRADLLRCKWLQVRWMEPFPEDGSDFAPWCARHLLRCAEVHRRLVGNL